jgi:hypothetical protein
MSSDTEHQQVDIALMEESEKPSSEKVKQISKTRRPTKNYCTEDYIVGYGLLILIFILVIVGIILAVIVIQNYNKCTNTKGASCRGVRWFFT